MTPAEALALKALLLVIALAVVVMLAAFVFATRKPRNDPPRDVPDADPVLGHTEKVERR